MNNYLKCKFKLDFKKSEYEALNVDFESVNFLCDSIDGRFGDFLIRKNGELCHNIIEYEKVDTSQAGEPGVIWNGTGYAKVKKKDWVRVNYDGNLEINTQIMAKKTDALINVKFVFLNGFVSSQIVNVKLIDNKERIKHTEKIKNIAIKRAKKMNSNWYKFLNFIIINPLVKICILLRFPLVFCQEMLIKLENKLKNIL